MSSIFDLFKQIEQKKPEASGPVTHMVVGLGNPGAKYAKNRHNAGFLCVEYLEQKWKVRADRVKFKALVGEVTVAEKRVLLLKPQTFMNLSGEAVREAAAFYKIPTENIIVIYDDINLEPGKLRIRRKGSDGGHNGIKSIIQQLGENTFPRVKLGVGNKPHPDYDLADWVLGDIPTEKQQDFFDCLARAAEAIELMLAGKTDDAMSKYNA